MAVILKNGASRTGTRANSTVPIRSSVITIAQTGLVSKLESEGKTVNALNLGYQGDHNVTRLYIKLWKTNTAGFANRYKAALVFHNEKNKTSYTASMERNDIDGYYVDLPDTVTKDSGNYQMYFLLKEDLSPSSEGGGDVGVDDDPAYREVFVSAAWKGVVSEKSAFSLVPKGFNWESDLYDYNKGYLTPYSWEPEEEPGVYSTSLYLPGLQANLDAEDIKYQLPPELKLHTTPSLSSSTYIYNLSIETIRDLTEKELIAAFEKIIIEYPVQFSVSGYDPNNEMHKKPIVVDYTPNSIKVKDNENLGMKYDSYITPINIESLYSLPGETKKYILFSKNQETLICQSFGDYCWIPAQVTADSGSWQVSFIVKGISTEATTDEEGNHITIKNEDYVYNTGILKLSVLDNSLSKSDLATDTATRAVIDSDGKTLYDKNSYALYATSTSNINARLEHSASTINSAIGWVDAILAQQVTAQEVVSMVDSFEQVSSDYSNVKLKIDQLTLKDSNLQTQINELDTEVSSIQETIETLDVTILKNTVEQHSTNIEDLKTRTNTLEGKTTSLETKDKILESNISSNTSKISKNEKDIKDLYSASASLDGRVDVLEGRANTISESLTDTIHEVDELQTRTGLLEAGFESQKSYVAAQLTAEIAARTEEDIKLQTQITNEVAIRKSTDEELQTQINNLTNEHDTTKTNLENLQKKHNEDIFAEENARKAEDLELNTKLSSLNSSYQKQGEEIKAIEGRLGSIEDDDGIYIKNNSKESPENPYVVRIVFLKSEQEYEALTTKDAGTLYLIQEEE